MLLIFRCRRNFIISSQDLVTDLQNLHLSEFDSVLVHYQELHFVACLTLRLLGFFHTTGEALFFIDHEAEIALREPVRFDFLSTRNIAAAA